MMVNERKGRNKTRSLTCFKVHLLLVALQFAFLSFSCWRIHQGDALLLLPSSFLASLTALATWHDDSLPPFDLEIDYSYTFTDIKKELRMMESSLQAAAGLERINAVRSMKAPTLNDWTLFAGAHGGAFELGSPYNPSMDSVARAIDAMKVHQARIDPLADVMKVRFFVRNKSLSQIRDVYKNWVAAEEAFDQLLPLPNRANRGRKSSSVAREFPSVQDAFDKLDACTTIPCLYETAQPNRGLPLHAPRRYLMGLRRDKEATKRLQEKGIEGTFLPLKFEFRGQQSSVDSQFVVAWIRLLRAFVHASFDGVIMSPEQRSVHEIWSDLFANLIRDDELHDYFSRHRALLAPRADAYVALERTLQGDERIDDSGLHYGVEVEYLFPKSARNTDEEENRAKWLNTMGELLGQAGVPHQVFLKKKGAKVVSEDSWKVVKERQGFEVVSPLDPSLASVVKAVNVMRQKEPLISDMTNVIHVNVDAHNRTLEEIRRVMTNLIVVEKALDEIRTPTYRGGRHQKAMSVGAEFSSVVDAFERLDECQSIGCLIGTAMPKCSLPPDNPHYYNLSIRRHHPDFPERLEFRGQRSSLDSHFVAAWVKLAYNLIRKSYDGKQLDARERTVDEAWSALFDELIQDEDLKRFFDIYRADLNQRIEASTF